MNRIHQLSDIASPALGDTSPDLARLRKRFGDDAAEILASILANKNGFYAFEGALHVFPDVGAPPHRGLHDWNALDLWRSGYQGMADDLVFFAEDAFGTQFCIRRAVIGTFEPETGQFEEIASTAEEWAAKIMDDHSFWTGHPVAREWQTQHGPLPVGSRLVPATLFVLGGAYEAENVRAIDAVEGMAYRADIAMQIRDLPNGAQIELRSVD